MSIIEFSSFRNMGILRFALESESAVKIRAITVAIYLSDCFSIAINDE